MKSDCLTIDDLRAASGGKVGTFDVACPLCGPKCRSPSNRKREVLRIWDDGEFVTYKCARCDAHGWARDDNAEGVAPRPKQKTHEVDTTDKAALARFLWGRSMTASGTLVETYLRSRHCWLPSEHIRFLPGRAEHPPAMIARFDAVGMPTGVHLTKLKADGSGKAGTEKDKIMLGPSQGQPIMVHDNPDAGEIFITEGIEDAASLAIATGWTAWAAGSAGRIAGIIPLAKRYEKVFVPMDRDLAGRRALERSRALRPDIIPLKLWRVLRCDDAADANKALIAFGPDALLAAIEWCDALASHGRGVMGFSAMMRASERARAVFRDLADDGVL